MTTGVCPRLPTLHENTQKIHLKDVCAAATDDHLDAALVERLRQCLADSRAAAGDVCHLWGECHREELRGTGCLTGKEKLSVVYSCGWS